MEGNSNENIKNTGYHFDRMMKDYELHKDARDLLDKELNSNAKRLLRSAFNEAEKKGDKLIITSHVKQALEKLNNDVKKWHPVAKLLNTIGSILLGTCVTHIVAINNGDKASVIIVILGIIGALMVGIGLFYPSKK